ncbi:hypothetical protein AAF712_003576 [Marasmius tenuissimus]|uniref:Peptidase C1A papain C-terminal domain-containing protein n=1 Tax=Marasmius tenuissimus TaxID=585030 RepID=A0ABR3A8A2_9AGAR
MALRLVAFFVCAVLSLGVKAADWYTVEWDAPQFTAMSGDFVVPKLPNTGGDCYFCVTVAQCIRIFLTGVDRNPLRLAWSSE